MIKEAPIANPVFRLKKARVPVLLAATLATFGAAHAQSDSGAAPQTVERITVTGSNIRRADTETPSPVQIITSDDLKASGYTSVAQVLQNITANGQGTLSTGFPQAFAGGASGISLFGLNTSATLVLIDGHRMAPYPLSDDGQRSFVDISNIPFDAIESIEVLKDGASAVYGSDAMAGVVNIKLKKNFIGTSITAETGTSQEGGGSTSHAAIMHGWGDFDADGYNAYFGVEYRHQDEITYGERAGDGLWSSVNLSGIGGQNKTLGVVTPANPQPSTGPGSVYLTNPALTYGAPGSYYFYPGNCNYAAQQAGSCAYNNTYLQIEPQSQNVNLLASFTKKLGGDWKLDLKASLFDSQGEQYTPGNYQTFPQSFSPLVGVSAGVNPFLVGTTIPAITVPATYPGNKLGVAAFVNGVIPGTPPIHTEFESKATRLVADLTGTLAGWDIETAAGYTHVETQQDDYGGINVPYLNTLLNSPTNPFKITGGNSPQVLSAVFPETGADDNSYLEFAELHASRSLFTLPGGDFGFSTGASYTDRTMHSPAPGLIAAGLIGGNNAYVSGSQTDTSAYAEIDAPVLKSLELSLDGRYDHFNNAGDSTTGKFGFKFTPIEQIAFRGTIGTGFRAPNAAENGQSGQAYLAGQTNDPLLCPTGLAAPGQNLPRGEVIAYCSFAPTQLNSANPDLKPEKSVSRTFGVILEPIKGWSTTVDVYDISIKDQIVAGSLNIANAVRGTPVSSQCSDGNGGTFTCTPAAGPILYVPVEYINANSTTTSGIQFDSRYRFNLGEYGTLKADLNWNHTMGYVLTVDDVHYQLAGTHGPLIIGGDTGNPKDRIDFTLTWDRGPWEVASAVNYIGAFDLTDPSYGVYTCAVGATIAGWFPSSLPPDTYCKVKSFTDTDLTVRYKVDKQLTVFGSITNLFNQQPPVDISTYGGGVLPYNPSFHLVGAVGRFFNVGATYRF